MVDLKTPDAKADPSRQLLITLKVGFVLLGIAALASMINYIILHDHYSASSRLALFSASLHGFINPVPYAKLWLTRPWLVTSILSVFIFGIGVFFYFTRVLFLPPSEIPVCHGRQVKHTHSWFCEPDNGGEPFRLTGWGD